MMGHTLLFLILVCTIMSLYPLNGLLGSTLYPLKISDMSAVIECCTVLLWTVLAVAPQHQVSFFKLHVVGGNHGDYSGCATDAARIAGIAGILVRLACT